MKSDGYSLDDKRTELSTSDIPDIVARFHSLVKEKHISPESKRARTDQSFLVPKTDIVKNDYDLSINKYKESAYIAENYPHPREILAEISSMEQEINKGLKVLGKMIEECENGEALI